MDDFKKYLQQNKEQMDIDTPPVELFNRIQKQSVNRKGKVYSMFLRVVAAACFAAVIFFGAKFLLRGDDKKQVVASSTAKPVDSSRPSALNSIDTLHQLVKANSPEKVAQQKNTETKKQLPVAYQLLNSFENNYNKLVSLQLKSIRNTPILGESPGYFNGFKLRMHQIDEDEFMLKTQIKKNGLHDELLEQLINVYQQKINLLKDLQQEISSMNNKIKENRQPADSTRVYYINI